MTAPLSRRGFVAAGGALVVGLAVSPVRALAADRGPGAPAPLTAFLEISTNGGVRLWSPTTEMGQGTWTGQAMVIADELGVPLDRISVENPQPADPFRRNGSMSSGGSWGIRAWVEPLRKAAAQARTVLIEAAASQHRIPASSLSIANGEVRHGALPVGSIGAYASAAAKLPLPEAPVLKPASGRRLVGRSEPRLDIPAKVRGEPVFAADIRLPGMVHACARLSTVFGARLAGLDEGAARRVRGVEAVIPLETGAAVVAANSWAAMKGAEALAPRFAPAPADGLDSSAISAGMRAALDSPTAALAPRSAGDFDAAWAAAARQVDAVYEVPYLAHTPMEPWNAVVHFTADGSLDVWAPTQAQDRLMGAITAASGLPADRVRLHTTLPGGGFGRRLRDVEGIRDAVLVARQINRPVHFFWPREAEIGQGWYRPAQVARLRAALGPTGAVSGLWIRTAGPSMVLDFAAPATPIAEGGLDPTSIQSLGDTRYAFPAYRLDYVMKRFPVPTAPWRAVGSTQNGYFLECFLDEVARAAGTDPYQFRRTLLASDARALNVLDTAARASGWGRPLPRGHARGIAYVESYGSLCAEVVEASLEGGRPRIHKVTVALDCGTVVSRDGVLSQVEGGVVQGLSATLGEAVVIAGGAAANPNLDAYDVLRMPAAPARIDVHLIESGEKIGGVGEPPLPPAGPALVNALFALTGKPIRTLPILPALAGTAA
jgi:isoquinoline 1-oxidoreductase beta subunit